MTIIFFFVIGPFSLFFLCCDCCKETYPLVEHYKLDDTFALVAITSSVNADLTICIPPCTLLKQDTHNRHGTNVYVVNSPN